LELAHNAHGVFVPVEVRRAKSRERHGTTAEQVHRAAHVLTLAGKIEGLSGTLSDIAWVD
jgi:hypothetical protein